MISVPSRFSCCTFHCLRLYILHGANVDGSTNLGAEKETETIVGLCNKEWCSTLPVYCCCRIVLISAWNFCLILINTDCLLELHCYCCRVSVLLFTLNTCGCIRLCKHLKWQKNFGKCTMGGPPPTHQSDLSCIHFNVKAPWLPFISFYDIRSSHLLFACCIKIIPFI